MKKYIAIIVLLITSFSYLQARQLYVKSVGGSNTNNGLSENLAVASLLQAVAISQPNDTINVFSGTYFETNTILVSKTLYIRKYGVGGKPVFNAGALGSASKATGVFRINNANKVVLDSLSITNCIGDYSKGIFIDGFGDSIVIKNCSISKIGWVDNLSTIPSLGIHNSNPLIAQGTAATAITRLILSKDSVYNCAVGFSEGVTIKGFVNGFAIQDCIVFDISNVGIDAAGNTVNTNSNAALNYCRNGNIRNNRVYNCMSAVRISAGIYLDGAVNTKVEGNEIYKCGTGISVGCEIGPGIGGTNVLNDTILNNLVYRNITNGMTLGHGDTISARVPVSNILVYNNTLFSNRTGQTVNGVITIGSLPLSNYSTDYGGEIHLQNSNNLVLRNNIIWPMINKRSIIQTSYYGVTNYSSNYNLFNALSGSIFEISQFNRGFNGNILTSYFSSTIPITIGSTTIEGNSIIGEPKFMDTTASNFIILSNSNAVDAGDIAYNISLSGNQDFYKWNRYINGRVDIGASEYQGSLANPVFISFNAIKKTNTIFLTWQVSSSSNIQYFTLQKQMGGTFRDIATIPYSATVFNTYTDSFAVNGTNTYRLRANLSSNSIAYSQMVSVDFNGSKEIQVYPNPTTDIIKIVSKNTRIKSIAVYGVDGKLLQNLIVTNSGDYSIKAIAGNMELIILQILLSNADKISKYILLR